MSSPEIVQWLESTPEASVEPKDSDYLEPAAVSKTIREHPSNVAILDLRKNDFLGGKIKGAFNIPAQSIYHSVPDLYDLFEKSGKKEIIIHCVSSRHRASRTWGWFKDYAETKPKDEKLQVHILKGGFNAFKADASNSDLIDN